MGLDVSTAVVTLTHDPKLDDPALESALKSDAFYIGALGSRRTHAKRKERLAEVGITDEHVRPHPRAGRPQHRRQVAGRDRRVDPGPDHRGAGAPPRGAGRRPRWRQREIRRDARSTRRPAPSWRIAGARAASTSPRAGGCRPTTSPSSRPPAPSTRGRGAPRSRRRPRGRGGGGGRQGAGRRGHRDHRAVHRPLQPLRQARPGVAVVDHERIDALNELDESVTVATLPPFARVEPRQMVATVKIIPYAAPRTAVDARHRGREVGQPAADLGRAVQGDARRPGADQAAGHARQGPRQGGRARRASA